MIPSARQVRPRELPVRVLVVDDSVVIRRMLTKFIESDGMMKVVDSARDGQQALEKVQALAPDVMTLDVEMPVMDGLGVLARLRTLRPELRPAVLMCSTLTAAGSTHALEAMRLGAADVIAKDVSDEETLRREVISKLRAIGEARKQKFPPRPTSPANLPKREYQLVVVGSSTGGPPVVERLISGLPRTLSTPLILAQHMPAMFTKGLADRLAQISAVAVHHADQDMPLERGHVYIIQGGKHGRVHATPAGRLRLEISDEPKTALYKPCVNELFASAAQATGEATIGVVLTGMGDDGLIGGRELAASRGVILAQEGSTCVVYGMPKAVVDAGIATPGTPDSILAALVSAVGGKAAAKVA
jgi:two-component system chemotaxis response regulator CheB